MSLTAAEVETAAANHLVPSIPRVEAFLDRLAEMRGHHPEIIHSIGDVVGEILDLTVSDLRTLISLAETGLERSAI